MKSVFSQANGFICREESPDFGIDIEAELIVNGQASGYRFVIQVKSSDRLLQSTFQGIPSVKYRFETSRLGYLSRFQPGYGLIVLYDGKTGTAYYDHIEAVCSRISSAKSPTAWQQQTNVTIHIPVSNVLDNLAASRIHATYRQRFENHAILIARHGSAYGIPVINKSSKVPIPEPDDPNAIADFLSNYGAILVNARDFNILIGMLRELTVRSFEESPQLCFIAAITYSESGRIIDAEHYLRKAQSFRSRLSEEKNVLVEMSISEVDYRFGRIDTEEYIHQLEAIRPRVMLPVNRLGLALRIHYLKILDSFGKKSWSYQQRLLKDLMNIEEEIETTKMEESTRRLLLIVASGYKHQLGLNLQASAVIALRIRQKILGPVPIEDRLASAKYILAILQSASATLFNVYRGLSDQEPDKLIERYVRNRLATNFFSMAFNSFMLSSGTGASNPPQDYQTFVDNYWHGIAAYNAFVEAGELEEAFSSITTAYEIRVLCNQTHTEKITSPGEAEILSRINAIALKLAKSPYRSLVEQYVSESLPRLEQISKEDLSSIAPNEEQMFAKTLVEALNLPSDRIPNIVNDIRAHRKFREAISFPSAELLQNLRHAESTTTMYAGRVTYIGHCSACGFETRPSGEVEVIIAEFLERHGYRCRRR